MGVNNVAGRQNKCGHGVIMYTYPAWTFGGKHKGDEAPPGPGPGKFVMPSTLNGIGPGFGRPHRSGQAAAHGSHTPGALPKLSKGPAHSFGLLLPKKDAANPGPQDYQVGAWPSNVHAGATWGPPPSRRAATAPRPLRVEETLVRKTKGPSFGLAYKPNKDADVPGPSAYQPLCEGCCVACQGYKGHTFGLRPPMIYGKVTTRTPGPANYHTDCTTIGAATQNCESGSSTFRNRSNRSA